MPSREETPRVYADPVPLRRIAASELAEGSLALALHVYDDDTGLWNRARDGEAMKVLALRVAELETENDELRAGRVTRVQIAEQRGTGWPDFRPEDYCHRCGGRNAGSWSVSSPHWNAARVEESVGSGIVCPSCFVSLYVETTGSDHGWLLVERDDAAPREQADED